MPMSGELRSHAMSTLLVVLLIGAIVRLTMLVTTDWVLEPLRSKIEGPKMMVYVLRCDWCMSVWVGFAVALFGWYAPDTLVWVVATALTGSLVTGIISDVIAVKLTESE